MKTIFLSFTLILAACGRSGEDPELQPYLTRFEQDAASIGHPVSVKGISIHFADLSAKGLNGECHREVFGNYILIDSTFWAGSSDIPREEVVYHELGHCFLNETHRPGGESIMDPNTTQILMYSDHKAAYLQELFSKVDQ